MSLDVFSFLRLLHFFGCHTGPFGYCQFCGFRLDGNETKATF